MPHPFSAPPLTAPVAARTPAVVHGGWGRKLRKVARLVRVARFRHALCHGVAAADEHMRALAGLAPRTVVDAGANKGQFALLALELFPQAVVHAFEPLAAPRARMMRWAVRERRLTVHTVALGQRDEEAAMTVSAQNDSSSLRAITARQVALFPKTRPVGTETVQVARLDRALQADDLIEPALLKIDVQGCELDVLHGAGDLIDRFDWVYVECSFVELYAGQALTNDVAAFLEAKGFTRVGIWNLIRDTAGAPLQGDFLFSRLHRDPCRS